MVSRKTPTMLVPLCTAWRVQWRGSLAEFPQPASSLTRNSRNSYLGSPPPDVHSRPHQEQQTKTCDTNGHPRARLEREFRRFWPMCAKPRKRIDFRGSARNIYFWAEREFPALLVVWACQQKQLIFGRGQFFFRA